MKITSAKSDRGWNKICSKWNIFCSNFNIFEYIYIIEYQYFMVLVLVLEVQRRATN